MFHSTRRQYITFQVVYYVPASHFPYFYVNNLGFFALQIEYRLPKIDAKKGKNSAICSKLNTYLPVLFLTFVYAKKEVSVFYKSHNMISENEKRLVLENPLLLLQIREYYLRISRTHQSTFFGCCFYFKSIFSIDKNFK